MPRVFSDRAWKSKTLINNDFSDSTRSVEDYNDGVTQNLQDSPSELNRSVPFSQQDLQEKYNIYAGGRQVPIAALFQGVTTQYSHSKADRDVTLKEYYEANWLAPTVIQEAASKVTDPAVGIGVEAARKRAEALERNQFLNMKRIAAVVEFLKESETFAEGFMWCINAVLKMRSKDYEGNDNPQDGTSYLEAQSACAMDFLQGGGLFRPVEYVTERLIQEVMDSPLEGQEGFNFRHHPANYVAPEALIGQRPVTGLLVSKDPLDNTPIFSNDMTLSQMIFHHESRFLETVSVAEPITGRQLPIYMGFMQRINYTLMRDDFINFIGDIEWKFPIPVTGLVKRYFLQNLFRDGEVRLVPPKFRQSEYYQSKIAHKIERLAYILYRYCKADEYIYSPGAASNAIGNLDSALTKGTIWEMLQGRANDALISGANIPRITDEEFGELSLPYASYTIATAKGYWNLYREIYKDGTDLCAPLTPVNTTVSGVHWDDRLRKLKNDPGFQNEFWRSVYTHARLTSLGDILLMGDIFRQAIDSTAFSLIASDQQVEMARRLLERGLGGGKRSQDSLREISGQLREQLDALYQRGQRES